MKKKLIVYGAGHNCQYFLRAKVFSRPFEIIAIVDSNEAIQGNNVEGIPVSSPASIKTSVYDFILITPDKCEGIRDWLVSDGGVNPDQILYFRDLKKNLLEILKKEYGSCNNEEIQEFLVSAYDEKSQQFHIFGAYSPSDTYDSVHWDEDGFPYIIFEQKYRMYFPKDFSFAHRDGRPYVMNLLWEQQADSPHLYVDGPISGNVLIDAGTCEGNFALRFVDSFQQLYLIEGDSRWAEVLRKTFSPFGDRVHIIDKFLSRYDTDDSIRLDSLPISSVDFLKMDIEGAEVDALLGGKRLLQRSHGHAAICAYHRKNDEENIRFILRKYGYQTNTSNGYMCFVYDQDGIAELRRGIVYAEKIDKVDDSL